MSVKGYKDVKCRAVLKKCEEVGGTVIIQSRNTLKIVFHKLRKRPNYIGRGFQFAFGKEMLAVL